MSTPDLVRQFLRDFKAKMKIWDVFYRDDRGKNIQTLLELELTPATRRIILEQLEIKDYSQGPIPEKLYGGNPLWVFGKIVRGKEVYIKITLGSRSSSVICISFHLANHKLTYPLK